MAKTKKKAKAKASAGPTRAPTGGTSGRARIETKLSAKMICGTVAAMFAEDAQDGDEIDLFTVYGEATTTIVKETSFGESTGLVGRFRAIRASDGKVFQAVKVYLPNVATEIAKITLGELQAKVKAAEAAGQQTAGAALEFALKIGARKDSSINVGYRYTCEPLMKEESDLFARLESTLALPAPKS